MRSPLSVLITVDSEIWPRDDRRSHWSAETLEPHIRREIYGETSTGAFGLPYQMDVLESCGLKGIFFLESFFASVVGIDPLRKIVEMIQSRGHEVQLHLHPEWLEWLPAAPFAGRKRENLKDFTEAEQDYLLNAATDNLKKAGVREILAFRAGNYGADFTTLRTLARHNIAFDSSYNIAYLDSDCGLRLPEPLVQARMIDGVCEVPVSHFHDYPGHRRHLQFCSSSFQETKLALNQAWQAGWKTFVIVSHSFEFLKRNRSGVPDRPDPIVRSRFERLCQFLADNSDRFKTVGFAELDPKDILDGDHSRRELQSTMALTGLRYAEQFLRRLT